MGGEFDVVVTRLRAAYRQGSRRERAELLDRLWSLVPKLELPEPEGEPRTTSAEIRCPVCEAELRVTLAG